MTDNPSTAIERHQPHSQAPAILDERAQASLRFRARSLAALDNRIAKIDDPTEREKMAVGLAITLDSLGLSVDPIQARKLHLIGGDWTPSAQLLVELVQRRGHDIVPVTMNRDTAVFRGRRFGRGEPITVEYSIDDARESGALDEWVEKWAETNRGKRYLADRYVVSTDGEPNTEEMPDWAKKEIADRKTKRNDAWFKYRIDMLCNRCVKRLCKWMAADALNGYGPVAFGGLDDDVVTVAEFVDAADGDDSERDDVEDADIVDEPSADAEGGETDVTDPPATPADNAPSEEALAAAEARRPKASLEWINDFVAHCAELAPDGVQPGSVAAAIVRKVTEGERSEPSTIRKGSEQTRIANCVTELVDGRWELAKIDGRLELVEAQP